MKNVIFKSKFIGGFMISATILLSVFQACKKKSTTATTYTPPAGSYAQLYKKVFATSCALSNCHDNINHSTNGHAHGVTLEGADAYNDLINNTPQNAQAVAAGLRIVAPNDTAKSFLYNKVNYNNSVHKYGAPMPGGGLDLTSNQIKFISAWIMAGAPEAGYVADSTLLN